MSLFQCSKCGCIENTACCRGGHLLNLFEKGDSRKEIFKSYREILGLQSEEKFGEYCCVCNPIWYKDHNLASGAPLEPAKWHNKFKRMFLPLGQWETNGEGNLQHKITGETDYSKYIIKSR
jgi:hypothetical protein